jgi:hypothetical protein
MMLYTPYSPFLRILLTTKYVKYWVANGISVFDIADGGVNADRRGYVGLLSWEIYANIVWKRY